MSDKIIDWGKRPNEGPSDSATVHGQRRSTNDVQGLPFSSQRTPAQGPANAHVEDARLRPNDPRVEGSDA